jgi:hypothetical protein
MRLERVCKNLDFMSYEQRREHFSKIYYERNMDLAIAREKKITSRVNNTKKAKDKKRDDRITVTKDQYLELKKLGII